MESWEYLFALKCHSGVLSELHVHSDFQGQVCARRSDELMFAWTLKFGYRKLCGFGEKVVFYPLSSVWESFWVTCDWALLR